MLFVSYVADLIKVYKYKKITSHTNASQFFKNAFLPDP